MNPIIMWKLQLHVGLQPLSSKFSTLTVKFGKDIKKKNTSVKYFIPHWNTEYKLVIFFIILIVLVIIIPLLVFVCHPY